MVSWLLWLMVIMVICTMANGYYAYIRWLNMMTPVGCCWVPHVLRAIRMYQLSIVATPLWDWVEQVTPKIG